MENQDSAEYHCESDGMDGQTIEWYGSGKYPQNYLHRVDGPAVIISNGRYCTKQYWQHHKLHRIDGPAVTWYDPDDDMWKGTYYILGVKITCTQFNTPGFVDTFILEHS